MGSARPT